MTTQAVALPVLAHRPVNKYLVTVSVTFGTLMGTIDASIVNVAIPHIRGAVGASITEITWITTGFVIATVLIMPLTAFIGRFVGQKRFYMISLALFIAGSALCGMARTLTTLVAFRAIQGLGAGALQPTEQAILRQTFPPEEQGMAMALFGMAVMLGPAIGPTLGGYIVDHYSWPWIFYINLPVGALGLYMVSRFVPEPEDILRKNREIAEQQRKNLDWIGIVLLSVGLCTLQYVLEEGESENWFESGKIVTMLLVSAVSLAAFTIRELTAPVPAVNLRLFRDRVFLSGSVVGALMFAMLLSNMFLLPLFMQELLGFSAVQSGLALVPRVAVMMVATPIVGRLYNRVPVRLVVGLGVVLVAAGAFAMSEFTLDTSASGIIGAIALQGVGFSCLFVPLTTVALSNVQRHQLADATGLNSLLRQVGGSIGLAAMASVLSSSAETARTSLTAHLSGTRPEVTTYLDRATAALAMRGYDFASAKLAALEALDYRIARQAFVLAFERVFFISAVAFLAILPVLYYLRAPTRPSRVHTEPIES